MSNSSMSFLEALGVSLSGMTTVFLSLVALALAIILVGMVLSFMGLGANMQSKKQNAPVKTASTMPASANANVSKAAVQEDMQEYAVILATISEHTRVPIERLKIKSITKR